MIASCSLNIISHPLVVAMLANTLRRFTFSKLNFYRPHMQNYFDGDRSRLEAEAQSLRKRYSLNGKHLEKLFRINPEVFLHISSARTPSLIEAPNSKIR